MKFILVFNLIPIKLKPNLKPSILYLIIIFIRS